RFQTALLLRVNALRLLRVLEMISLLLSFVSEACLRFLFSRISHCCRFQFGMFPVLSYRFAKRWPLLCSQASLRTIFRMGLVLSDGRTEPILTAPFRKVL